MPERTDEGGVWVMTGVVLGLVAYATAVVLLIAGYTSILPLVIVPLVLAGLIGANNLLGGGRTYGRTPGRPVGHGQAPLSSSGPNGPRPDTTEEPVVAGPESSASSTTDSSATDGGRTPVIPDIPVTPASSGPPASPDAQGDGV